jgi:GNAT superfamily N-acetyltransferase
MKIRKAVLRDAGIIAEFNVNLARETEGLKLDLETVRKGVEALLKDRVKGVYFVAEMDGKPPTSSKVKVQSSKSKAGEIAGQLCVTHEWSDWRNGDFWWIQSVYVKKEWRGRGIFAALFEHVQQLAREQPEVCGLRLYMEKGNERARRVYQKLGMKQTHYHVFEKLIRGAGVE